MYKFLVEVVTVDMDVNEVLCVKEYKVNHYSELKLKADYENAIDLQYNKDNNLSTFINVTMLSEVLNVA